MDFAGLAVVGGDFLRFVLDLVLVLDLDYADLLIEVTNRFKDVVESACLSDLS